RPLSERQATTSRRPVRIDVGACRDKRPQMLVVTQVGSGTEMRAHSKRGRRQERGQRSPDQGAAGYRWASNGLYSLKCGLFRRRRWLATTDDWEYRIHPTQPTRCKKCRSATART